MRLFVDANTLVSALVFEGNESLLLDLCRLGVCALVTIEYVRVEVRDVISRPRLNLTAAERDGAMAILARHIIVLDDPPIEAVKAARGRVTDEADLPILVGFELSGCDFLVTGDQRLRRLIPKAITTREALRLAIGRIL